MKLKTLISLLLSVLFLSGIKAQTTETFETESNLSTSFTDNSQVFNITSQVQGPFDIQTGYAGTGWNGTSPDNRYIDNDLYAVNGFPVGFTISSSGAVSFYLNSMWMYLADASANNNVSGSLTIVGKLGGVTKFTASASSGFNTTAANNGFSFINMATFGGSNNTAVSIDQIVITIGDNISSDNTACKTSDIFFFTDDNFTALLTTSPCASSTEIIFPCL